MKINFRWIPAITAPVPPIGVITAGLAINRLTPGTTLALGLAGLAGMLFLLVLAVLAREQTRRAALPYLAQITLAKAEARNRTRYAKAQTRRFYRMPSGENYSPDKATDLARIITGTQAHSAGDGSITRLAA